MLLDPLINAEQASKSIVHTSDVDPLRSVDKLPSHLVDGHVAHKKCKTNPWHKRPFHIASNRIGTDRADEQCADASPEIKKANKVEKRYPW